MNNEEIWKVIPDFPNYEASSLGRIRRKKNQKVIRQFDADNRTYQIISIYYNGKKYTKKVSRLIWTAFNECPCALTIDHVDRNPANNAIDNLRCVSLKENCKNRTIYKTKNKYNLTDKDKIEIVRNYEKGIWSSWTISKIYKIPTNYILTVLKRGTWHKLCQEQPIQDTNNISQ